MWQCTHCHRSFQRIHQQHSCRSAPLAEHFRGRPDARPLFDHLISAIEAPAHSVKHSVRIGSVHDIDRQLLGWIIRAHRQRLQGERSA